MNKKLYLLTRKTEVGFDEAVEFVVRARSPVEARKLASQQHGDEPPTTWLQPKLSECQVLDAYGDLGVIVRNFNAG